MTSAYTHGLEEHVPQVRLILGHLRTNDLYAKVEMCEFYTQNIAFLGYHISPADVGMDQTKGTPVVNWPTSSTIKEV